MRRAARPNGRVGVYGLPLRQRLPSIRIPLREEDEDIRLDLQTLIDEAYRRGRYELTDYSQPPVPPLDAADAEWAKAMIEGWRKELAGSSSSSPQD